MTNEHVRLSLDLVEEAIAVDPYHRFRRSEIDGIVYDVTDPSLMVAYAVVDDDVVLLAFVT